MENIKNNDMIEEIQRLLIECMENENLNKSNILQRRINYIYSMLKVNPICFYKHFKEVELIIQNIKLFLKKAKNPNDENYLYLARIRSLINKLHRLCLPDTDYNSEDYYIKQIGELKNKESELNKQLLNLKQKEAEHEETENNLNYVKEQIKQYEIEIEELKKKSDARENIKVRISTAFEELKKHISHLKNEKTRLNWMFYIYAFLSICVFVGLIYFECKFLSQWKTGNKWVDYLHFYIPIPIFGGLLWVFISQMNRAQRQLMQVANALYHIDYVEGLLLAINQISTDVNSASDKICSVLNHLIKNHMSTSDNLSEQSLDAEISKDNINLNTFLNLAKEVKEVIK